MFFEKDDLQGLSQDLREEILSHDGKLDFATGVIEKLDEIARQFGFDSYLSVVAMIATHSKKLEELLIKAREETPFSSVKDEINDALENLVPLNVMIKESQDSIVENVPQQFFDNESLRGYVMS
jgi:hypothetical protein